MVTRPTALSTVMIYSHKQMQAWEEMDGLIPFVSLKLEGESYPNSNFDRIQKAGLPAQPENQSCKSVASDLIEEASTVSHLSRVLQSQNRRRSPGKGGSDAFLYGKTYFICPGHYSSESPKAPGILHRCHKSE